LHDKFVRFYPKLTFSLRFLYVSNTKFNANPSIGSRIDTYGQADGWTDRITLATILVEEGALLGRFSVADNSENYWGSSWHVPHVLT
jgi:hypothetical protein